MAQVTERRQVNIVVDTKGAPELKNLATQLGGINKNTKELATSMNTLSSGAATFLGGLSIRELVRFSDEIQNLNNKLFAMTGNQEQATATMNNLVAIARETNSGVDAASNAYFRMAQALKEAKTSQSGLLDLTKVIVNTFRLSGASTEEATNATIQLGQAFSLGTLRGQDLRSVMSQNVVLTRLLRQEFGQNLLKEAEKGFITVPRLMEVLFRNMKQINAEASVMQATFDQGVTKALDAFKLKIYEVNVAIGASGVFNKAINYTVKNMDTVIVVLANLAYATMPVLIIQIYKLAGALGLLNPIVLIFGAAAALVTGTAWLLGINNFKEFVSALKAGFFELKGYFYDFIASIATGLAAIVGPLSRGVFDNLATGYKKSAKEAHAYAETLRNAAEYDKAYLELQETRAKETANHAKDIASAKQYFVEDLDPKQLLAKLNRRYQEGRIDVAQYNEEILKTNMDQAAKKFKEGEYDLGKLNDAYRKVDVFRLNRELNAGTISIDQYNRKLSELKLANLKEDLDSGRISLAEFNSKLSEVSDKFTAGGAFRTGLQDYLISIGTTTQQVAKMITNAFGNLENVFVEFVKTGKFNFNQFTQAVLDDLTRIIIRATIIAPLAKGILSYLPASSPGTAGPSPIQGYVAGGINAEAAKGAYFDGPMARFANGGVVHSATSFGYGGGRRGLMGEAGPEAILPLSRGAGGKLGVQASVTPVTVNIINQANATTETQEKTGPNGERMIEVLIKQKVKEGFADGSFDKSMKSSYGVNRRGA